MRFQIDFSAYDVISVPCRHIDGWCHRTEGALQVMQLASVCFATKTEAYAALLSHARERYAIAVVESRNRKALLEKAGKAAAV